MIDLFVLLSSFFITLFLTVRVKSYLLARAVLDHPNERSSHKKSVPRGGGWAMLIVLGCGLILTGFLQHHILDHSGLFVSLFLLTLLSWHDDKKHLNPVLRLVAHFLAAFLGSLSFSHDQLLFDQALPFWLDRLLMIIGWAWFINLYNFMDGIDGMTCAETISIATGVCLVMTAANFNDPFVNNLTLLLTGAALGFLALNWHPAQIFMGDVGSVPLGFLIGYALLTLAMKGYPIPALLLPLYYLADSGLTITKRALRGEKVWQAHRQHFYQRAALKLKRHDTVVFWVVLANSGLIAAALLATAKPFLGMVCAVLIVALLLSKMHKSA